MGEKVKKDNNIRLYDLFMLQFFIQFCYILKLNVAPRAW